MDEGGIERVKAGPLSTSSPTPTLLRYPEPNHCGTLVRRYKRFFVDVRLDDGTEVVAHTANTGAMTGMKDPGMRVMVTFHDNPKRKLKYTLQAVHDGESWIGANPILSNRIAKTILTDGHLEEWSGYVDVKSEVKVSHGDDTSRLDFKLSGHPVERDAFVEVKSVTLREDDRALFPDAVTVRGRRHVEVLHALATQGHRAALLLLVQRADCSRFVPAYAVDPDYCEALERAAKAGVAIVAQEIIVDAEQVKLGRVLPTSLGANS